MNIFTQRKCASPLEFKCDHNELISRAIGHELNEIHAIFTPCNLKMEIFGSHLWYHLGHNNICPLDGIRILPLKNGLLLNLWLLEITIT